MEFHEKLAKVNELEQQGISFEDFEEISKYREYLREQDLRAANPTELEKLRTEFPTLPIEIYYSGNFFGFDGMQDYAGVMSSIRDILVETAKVPSLGLELSKSLVDSVIRDMTKFLVYKTPETVEHGEEQTLQYTPSSSLGYDYDDVYASCSNADDDSELPGHLAKMTNTIKHFSGETQEIINTHPEFIKLLILTKTAVAGKVELYDIEQWVIPITMTTVSHIEI